MNKMFGKFYVDLQMDGNMLLKIDVIYAYPLLAAGIGVFLLLIGYIMWRFYCELTAMRMLTHELQERSDTIIRLEQRHHQQIEYLFSLIEDLKPTSRKRAFLKFYTMGVDESSLGIKMTLPMLEISSSPTLAAAQKHIFWEGLVYIIKENLEIETNNLNSVMADFKNWQSKPVVE